MLHLKSYEKAVETNFKIVLFNQTFNLHVQMHCDVFKAYTSVFKQNWEFNEIRNVFLLQLILSGAVRASINPGVTFSSTNNRREFLYLYLIYEENDYLEKREIKTNKQRRFFYLLTLDCVLRSGCCKSELFPAV